VADVASLVDASKRATEEREAALRDQINVALQRVRGYARDMEVRRDVLAQAPTSVADLCAHVCW
jgi:hypothetical protein